MTRAGRSDEPVFVESQGRLHFGVLDLRGGGARWFGGIGTAAPGPSVLVSVSRAGTIEATGEDAGRAAEIARRYLAAQGLDSGARIEVHRSIPAHVGLGSGTQLALALARGLAEVCGASTDVETLASAVGRGQRSAIGMWTFADGGLVVEGGRRRDGVTHGPLVARMPFPAAWRGVVAVPGGARGLSGSAEVAAFERLPPPPAGEAEAVAHLVLMGLLPALAEADLPAFGAALSDIQARTGGWFSMLQGGRFAPGATARLVERMRAWSAHGVGQSSWGPAVYGVVEGDEACAALAAWLRADLGPGGLVYHGAFPTAGARVWRGARVNG